MPEYISKHKVNRLLDLKDRTLTIEQKRQLVKELSDGNVKTHRYKMDHGKSRNWNREQNEKFQKEKDRA